eukprot:UN08991
MRIYKYMHIPVYVFILFVVGFVDIYFIQNSLKLF